MANYPIGSLPWCKEMYADTITELMSSNPDPINMAKGLVEAISEDLEYYEKQAAALREFKVQLQKALQDS